jgi:hypothetical protein
VVLFNDLSLALKTVPSPQYGLNEYLLNLPVSFQDHFISLPKIPYTGRWWLTPIILATQKAEIRRFEANPGKYFTRPYLITKNG